MSDRQLTLLGVMDEAEALAQLQVDREDRLQQAMRLAGIYENTTAWRLAMMIYHVTKRDGGRLEWLNRRIAGDSYLTMRNGRCPSIRAIQSAISKLRKTGILKQHDVVANGTRKSQRWIDHHKVCLICDGQSDAPEHQSTAKATTVEVGDNRQEKNRRLAPCRSREQEQEQGPPEQEFSTGSVDKYRRALVAAAKRWQDRFSHYDGIHLDEMAAMLSGNQITQKQMLQAIKETDREVKKGVALYPVGMLKEICCRINEEDFCR